MSNRLIPLSILMLPLAFAPAGTGLSAEGGAAGAAAGQEGGPAVAAFWPVMHESSTGIQLGVWDKCSVGPGTPLQNQCEFILVGSFGKPFIRRYGLSNIFRSPRVPPRQRRHPAQKPLPLVQQLAEALCPEGGAILDPFAGSCTTETAAVNLGLSCTVIDTDPAPDED